MTEKLVNDVYYNSIDVNRVAFSERIYSYVSGLRRENSVPNCLGFNKFEESEELRVVASSRREVTNKSIVVKNL